MSVHYAAVYQGDKLIAEYPTPGGAFAAAVLSVLPQLAETGKKSSARRTFSVDGNSVHCLKRNKLLHFCVGTKLKQSFKFLDGTSVDLAFSLRYYPELLHDYTPDLERNPTKQILKNHMKKYSSSASQNTKRNHTPRNVIIDIDDGDYGDGDSSAHPLLASEEDELLINPLEDPFYDKVKLLIIILFLLFILSILVYLVYCFWATNGHMH